MPAGWGRPGGRRAEFVALWMTAYSPEEVEEELSEVEVELDVPLDFESVL